MAVKALFQRPYWRPLWVLQEIMLVHSLVVICGYSKYGWICFEKFIGIPTPHPAHIEVVHEGGPLEPFPGADEVYSIVRMRIAFHGWGQQRRSFILAQFSSWQCKDPRGKIYGSLGLQKNSWVKIDYDKPVHEIYQEVIRKVVKNEDYLSLSSHLDFANTLKKNMSIEEDIDVEAFVWVEWENSHLGLRGQWWRKGLTHY